MAKIITFGELMLRLQPYNYERFVQCDHVEFTFGGGEANVAVSLANYGMDVAYVSKLPTHAIGQAAVNSLRRYGVDTSLITRGGNRVGMFTCLVQPIKPEPWLRFRLKRALERPVVRRLKHTKEEETP